MRSLYRFLNACSVALLLTASSALVLTTAVPDAAYAKGKESKSSDKSSKTKDKAKSKSKAKSKTKTKAKSKTKTKTKAKSSEAKTSGKSAKSSEAKTSGKSAKSKKERTSAPAKEPTARVPAAAQKIKSEDGQTGNTKAALGALNAANASETALANASSGSRVGQVAAYRDQVLAAQQLKTSLEDAKTLLASSDAPELNSDQYLALIEEEQSRKSDIETEIAEIQTALNAAGGENEELLAELAEAQAALAEQNKTLGALENDFAKATSYWAAQDAIVAQEAELEAARQKARVLLEIASNKPVTDEVVAEVNLLLDLLAE